MRAPSQEPVRIGAVDVEAFSRNLARVIRHLASVGLPTKIRDIPGAPPTLDRLMDLIGQDKKIKRGQLTFILARGIGSAFVETGVDAAEVRGFLSERLGER